MINMVRLTQEYAEAVVNSLAKFSRQELDDMIDTMDCWLTLAKLTRSKLIRKEARNAKKATTKVNTTKE